MNCLYCKDSDLREIISTGGYAFVCDKCEVYYFIDNPGGKVVIQFNVLFKEKSFPVIYWKVPGQNTFGVTEEGTGITYDKKLLYFEKDRIISSPQDAIDFANKVLKLKAFL